ncbi:hypothetical protein Hanom_Chr15g01393981 [Helianthus anomalus]
MCISFNFNVYIYVLVLIIIITIIIIKTRSMVGIDQNTSWLTSRLNRVSQLNRNDKKYKRQGSS